MRLMLFMSRMLGMVVLMIGVLLMVFVLLDVMREGPHARGFLLGTDMWKHLRGFVEALF